jgi:hypothetical protein
VPLKIKKKVTMEQTKKELQNDSSATNDVDKMKKEIRA